MENYHYVPVLRWKKGEIDALKMLGDQRRRMILPLLQPIGYDLYLKLGAVSREQVNDEYYKMMKKKVDSLQKSWGSGPLFIDGLYLEILRGILDPKYMYDVILALCRERDIPVIPVTGIGRYGDYQESVQSHIALDSNGVAIRVGVEELNSGAFNYQILGFIGSLNVALKSVDLIIDIGLVTKDRSNLDLATIFAIIPSLLEWRSIIMVGGSFPIDLGEFSLGRNEFQRWEWKFWSESIPNIYNTGRIPSFGDFTTRNPIIRPPVSFPPSASIRYATEEYWVIMRGQAPNKRTKGTGLHAAQYCGHCVMLVGMPEYSGAYYSYSDNYIFEKQYAFDHPGNSTNWVTVGVERHIAVSVDQVAKRFSIPANAAIRVAI